MHRAGGLSPADGDLPRGGLCRAPNAESAMGLPFQQDSRTRQRAGISNGPVQPQSLNRSSYVLNNPERWTDPSGTTRVRVGQGVVESFTRKYV